MEKKKNKNPHRTKNQENKKMLANDALGVCRDEGFNPVSGPLCPDGFETWRPVVNMRDIPVGAFVTWKTYSMPLTEWKPQTLVDASAVAKARHLAHHKKPAHCEADASCPFGKPDGWYVPGECSVQRAWDRAQLEVYGEKEPFPHYRKLHDERYIQVIQPEVFLPPVAAGAKPVKGKKRPNVKSYNEMTCEEASAKDDENRRREKALIDAKDAVRRVEHVVPPAHLGISDDQSSWVVAWWRMPIVKEPRDTNPPMPPLTCEFCAQRRSPAELEDIAWQVCPFGSMVYYLRVEICKDNQACQDAGNRLDFYFGNPFMFSGQHSLAYSRAEEECMHLKASELKRLELRRAAGFADDNDDVPPQPLADVAARERARRLLDLELGLRLAFGQANDDAPKYDLVWTMNSKGQVVPGQIQQGFDVVYNSTIKRHEACLVVTRSNNGSHTIPLSHFFMMNPHLRQHFRYTSNRYLPTRLPPPASQHIIYNRVESQLRDEFGPPCEEMRATQEECMRSRQELRQRSIDRSHQLDTLAVAYRTNK